MPPIYHVCIDTNIFIRLITQGMPGCEVEHWEKLKQYVRAGKVALLHPEVVRLELQKNWRAVPAKIQSETKALRTKMLKELRVKEMYTEVRDLRQTVESCLDIYAKNKETESKSRYEDILAFVEGKFASQLRIDHDILLRTERRALSGGLADPTKQSKADCMLIEQLSSYFEADKQAEANLLFCTENVADFASKVDGRYELHREIIPALPVTKLFLSLLKLVEFVGSQEKVEPVPADKVEKAAREEDLERVKGQTGPKRRVTLRELRDRAIAQQRVLHLVDVESARHMNTLVAESAKQTNSLVAAIQDATEKEAEIKRLLQQGAEIQRLVRENEELRKRYGAP